MLTVRNTMSGMKRKSDQKAGAGMKKKRPDATSSADLHQLREDMKMDIKNIGYVERTFSISMLKNNYIRVELPKRKILTPIFSK